MTDKKTEKKLRIVVPLIIEPVVSFALGFLVSTLLSLTFAESMLLSSMCTILVALLDLNVQSQLAARETAVRTEAIDEKLGSLKVLSTLQDKLTRIQHPYFQKWAMHRLSTFMKQNEAFFAGVNTTNPHAEDTFGISGIKETKSYGTLRAVSSVQNYWEDDFAREYLRVQGDLIKNKHVTIQRIFFFPQSKEETMREMMRRQAAMGIEVYYYYLENEYINASWKQEDFMLQDDTLLVQLTCSSHKYSEEEGDVELITLEPAVVEEKLELFFRMLERAKRFRE